MELSLSRPAMSLCACAEKFGPRMQTHLSAFRNCMKMASEIVQFQTDPGPLESQIGLLDDTLDALPDSDVLFHHINALCSAAAAFGCVSAENPSEQLNFIQEETNPSIKALQQMTDSSHSQFATAVASVFDALSEWIRDNLPTGIKPKAGSSASSSFSPITASSSQINESKDSQVAPTAPHLVSYRENISEGVVNLFKSAANALGGPVAQIAAPATEAFHEVYNFLVQASQLSSPPNDESKQEMIKKVVEQMTVVSQRSSECPFTDSFINHVKAVEEAMGMLSWIVAIEKPVTFITDAEGSSTFYLNKVLTATKKAPDASIHKAFVEALKTVFSCMKEYVREYHTMGVRYGVGLYAARTVASDLPSPVSVPDDEITGDNYVVAFQELIDGPLATYVQKSKALGGEVEEQAALFESAWQAEAEFLRKAICTPMPNADDLQTMLAPIAEKMGSVSAIVDKVDPRSPLSQHCNAVGESIGALGWVAVEEKATAFVGDMAGAGQFYMDKVKMSAKTATNGDHHRAWALALESLFSELKAYVKEHHTQRLQWNPPKRKAGTTGTAIVSSSKGSPIQRDYVVCFREIITGPLAAFVAASAVLGGEVQEQADAFAKVWEAEAEFLARAIETPKPDDIQEMLNPIAFEMGKVGAIVETLDPRGPFANHCNAVGESVAALGWVAVDEKATSFVGDMAGAGQFFLDKVKMEAKKANNPEAHKSWARSLEVLYATLKAYVKEHHTQMLVWNPPKRKVAKGVASSPEPHEAPRGTDYVSAFEDIVEGPLAAFLTTSDTLGAEVKEQALLLAEAWKAERDFLFKAMTMSKPDNIDEMVAPIGAKMSAVAEVVDKIDPRSSFAQHCNAVAESIGVLGWITVDEKATAYVGDMAGAGQFFIDKVKMDAKKTGNANSHKAWAQALEALLAELKAYVKEYHTQRLTWKTL